MRKKIEVDEQIDRLKKLHKQLPEINFFNENNHAIINAKLDVLEEIISSEDEIYKLEEEYGELGECGVSEVINVLQWLEEEMDEPPVPDGDLDEDTMRTKVKKPCSECPFRKNSFGGYLGGVWDAKTLHLFVMSEQKFACHKTIEEDGCEKGTSVCIGSVMYMNKNAKRVQKDETLKKLQEKYRGEDSSNILNTPEFLEHHTKAKIEKS